MLWYSYLIAYLIEALIIFALHVDRSCALR